jgi:oligopeptide/dipeptide ABC transporter ATP-binding protein
MTVLLEVHGLSVDFRVRGWGKPRFRAVDQVDLMIEDGEAVGLVGESGSGKTTIGRSILGLVPIAEGRILFEGEDIGESSKGNRRQMAGHLQVVFQDPFGSLSPARTVGESLAEPLKAQGGRSREEVRSIVTEMLARVSLPADTMSRYPYEFSGGQRQRICIARALTVRPKLVVCDESVSSLDVSTQAQVLNLLRELRADLGIGYLFISHNLDVVRYMADRIAVLYHGRVMEVGPSDVVHGRPCHPYTRALLAASPVPDPVLQAARREARQTTTRVTTAGAEVAPEEGCPFVPRCPFVAEVCWTQRPRLSVVEEGGVACHLYDEASGHPEAGGVPGSLSATETRRNDD